MNKADIREEMVSIPTYKIGKAEKSPLFIEKRAYQGSTGKVYPLPVTEKIYDEKVIKQYKALILENDYIYVMILPELGGRIQRAYDKTNGYDFVYHNHVIKPALVGLAGPWISGGIEFNWPQHHRPSTFSPVEYSYIENHDGSVSAFVGETDVMYGTKSVAEITLYPDKAYIEIKGQLYNPTDFAQTFLWWANPAVSVNDDTFSVFPPDVIAVMDHGKRAVSTFPIATGEYYKVDYSQGVDISRYKNIKVPTSYMAAHSDYDFFGNYDEGRQAGMLHVADHHISPGKKQWTWGCGDFGKMWDKNLTDDDGPYIELMAGVFTDNQPDFSWLKPNEEKTFTQYFMPYKAVGRVCNASKDILIGVENNSITIYSTGKFKNAVISVKISGKSVYEKTVDLSPGEYFTDSIQDLKDYTVKVFDCNNYNLCEYKEYISKSADIPEPADEMKAPEEISSLEELFLCGQHLEQYRHATYNPADYYVEGLKRDKTDIRLNNAYGLLLLRNGQIRESLSYFKTSIKKQTLRNPNPFYGECYYNLGVAYELLEVYDKAYDSFYKAIWSAETQSSALYHLACISNRNGNKSRTLEFVNESLIRNTHNMKARTLKAKLLENNNDFLKESYTVDRLCLGIAYQYLEKEKFAILMGDKVSNYLMLSLWYMEFGLYEKAIDILNTCSTPSPLILYYKGYAFNKLGNENEAIQCYKDAEQVESDYCFPNKIMEQIILEDAVETLDPAPMADYYLGNLLYDKKRYKDATLHWENTVKFIPDFSLAYRNLSISYFNNENDKAKALKAICRACELEKDNSRFILERDQLFAKEGYSVQERLMYLEQPIELLTDRDALCLAYIKLLNSCGRYADALSLLEKHKFHVWEGGEGKVADEYKTSLFSLAEIEIEKKNYCKATELAERTIEYPDNLGEGKLFNVPDNKAYYYVAKCYKELEEHEKSQYYFNKATEGSIVPEPVRYYNDQPSDYIYYIGLSYLELGKKENAKCAFQNLKDYGEEHISDQIRYDYFAVSLPEIEVYKDDLNIINRKYCEGLISLAEKGLKMI